MNWDERSSIAWEDSSILLKEGRSTKRRAVLIITGVVVATVFLCLCFALSFILLTRHVGTSGDYEDEYRPYVIIISIDGFRNDYLDWPNITAPTLRALASSGVRARLIPAFPTKTFTNHYSIITGLYPENHGIINNVMYDPVWNAWFSLSDIAALQDPRWWGGEPLWVTAERQGCTSATFFWPGSDTRIQGVLPTYRVPYNGTIPNLVRVRQILEWLQLPSDLRPHFLTLYFEAVDSAGHAFGPTSTQVAEAIRNVDSALGELVQGISNLGLDDMNIVVVSDHGMAATSAERVILVDNYISLSDVLLVTTSPILMLIPNEGKLDAVYDSLKNAHPNMTVYKKQDIPSRFYFTDNRRITPIVGVADIGWSISTSLLFNNQTAQRFIRGDHGYDNLLPEMQALFIANGPNFKSNTVAEPFANIEVYNLLANILRLTPAPNNGTLTNVSHLLL